LIKEKAFKYRIYPTKAQREIFEQYFGCSRFVFNYYLRKRIDCYAIHKKGLSYNDNANDLVFLKKELPWLKEVNSQSLQASLKDLETAYDRFFGFLRKSS
jgi:putative transposase